MSNYDMENGMTARQLFGQPYGWTFDDVILLPAFNCSVLKENVKLNASLGSLKLNLPLISSPMDTVTEAATAIEMALRGGLGFIHMNLPIAQAVTEVQRVKRYQMGIIHEPICRAPGDPISEVAAVKQQYGFSTLLITADGTTNSSLLGMVTKGHVALEPDPARPLGEIMIPYNDLLTVPASMITTWGEAREFFRQHPVAHKLPLVHADRSVAGFITRRDVVKMADCPNALVSSQTGQLLVGAAVSTHERDDERVAALLEARADVILIDSAQGGNKHAVRRIEQIRSQSDVLIVAGNIVTPAQAEPLVRAGAQALRTGMGSGSICTTQTVTGIGRPQLKAIYHVSQWLHRTGYAATLIADGGTRSSGDILKALACGASCVMLGRLIAGCSETPARLETHRGRHYKRYRGMGSEAALRKGGVLRYGLETDQSVVVAQGVEGLVPAEGLLNKLLSQFALALRTGLEYLGCDSIAALHQKVAIGAVRFELRSQAARIEGDPHDLSEA